MHRGEEILDASGSARRVGDPIRGLLQSLGPPSLSDVAEAPDTPHRVPADHLWLGVALVHAAVLEREDVEARRIGPPVELADLDDEGVRVRELLQHVRDQPVVVAGAQQPVREAPQLGELAVEARDLALAVHDQDAVGGGLERGRE